MITVHIGPVWSQFVGEIPVDEIDRATSCFKTGYRFTPSFRMKRWDGKMHLFKPRTRLLPTGVVPLALEAIRNLGIPYTLEHNRSPLEASRDAAEVYSGLTPRPYQLEAVQSVIDGTDCGQRGLLRLPTGSGKTLTAAILADRFQVPVLILVHGQQLVDQTRKEISRFLEEEVGLIMGDQTDLSRVTVGSVDTVCLRLEDDLFKNYLSLIQVLIADEAHRVGGGTSTFQKVMDSCPAVVRVGMSGTPLKKDQDTDLLLVSRTGPILYDLTPSALQEQGFLSKASLLIYEIDKPVIPDLTWREAINELVIDHHARTQFLVERCIDWVQEGKKVLVVAGNSVKLVRAFEERWEAETDLKGQFVTGSSGKNAVNAAVNALREGDIHLLCSTVLFDEGTDVPDLDVVLLAWPTKSFVKVMQRIGRGLRPKPTGLLVVDVYDSTNKYLKKHFKQRIKTYSEESLFSEADLLTATLDTELMPKEELDDDWEEEGT